MNSSITAVLPDWVDKAGWLHLLHHRLQLSGDITLPFATSLFDYSPHFVSTSVKMRRAYQCSSFHVRKGDLASEHDSVKSH